MKLVDADAAIKSLYELEDSMILFISIYDAIHAIEEQPTVCNGFVNCTACRYNDETAYCELHYRDVRGDDFCSWGEKINDSI